MDSRETESRPSRMYPITFLDYGKLRALPVPIARISMCGMIEVEVLIEVISNDPPQGRYEIISPQTLRGRGAVPSLMLLKLLAGCSHRFATCDWLSEQMGNEMEVGAVVRLDTIASYLRGVLCHLKAEREDVIDTLRLLLVTYLRNGRSSGPGYQLAPYPLLWLDTDALACHVEHATLMERMGESDGALPFWQHAYQLASRGSYLPDEVSSDWASEQRREVAGELHQSVQALYRLFLARHGEAGKEEAIAFLRTYWIGHPTDEDALRPLMELLGERERYQEAEEYYQACLSALDEEEKGRQPDERTRDVREFLRLKKIQRKPVARNTLASTSAAHASSVAFLPHETRLVESIGYVLADDKQLMDEHADQAGPLIAETRHLIGRDDWLAAVKVLLTAPRTKKLFIFSGPIGVGKSSEMNRLAHHFQCQEQGACQVIWLPMFSGERRNDPEAALDVFLGTLLNVCGQAPFPADASRQTVIALTMKALEQQSHLSLILLDNAECLLTEEGKLAPCWEDFLTQFLRYQHQAALLLATKEWHGWPGRDGQLVEEIVVPALTLEESVMLLQRLGLEGVPAEHLRTMSERVAGIPLCLEWLAKLAHDPLLLDDWKSFDENEETTTESHLDATTQRLSRLLEHPTLLGEHLASKLTPLLQHIIDQHLSAEARRVLEQLSVVGIPLGKPALRVFCPRPALLRELRDASLLAAYTNHIQLLPMVASTVRALLSPEQVYAMEERMIEALPQWLDDGRLSDSEVGSVVAERTALLLAHHRLLDAAEFLTRFGWRSFQFRHGPHLAHLAHDVLQEFAWHKKDQHECAGLILVQTLFQFLGKPVDPTQYADYSRIWKIIVDQKVPLPSATGIYVTHLLMLDATNHARFEEAQALLDAYSRSLDDPASLLEEHAFLFKIWSDYAEVQGDKQEAQHLREHAVDLHRKLVIQLSSQTTRYSFEEDTRKKRLASCLNNLAYNLHILGAYEEALQMVEQSILLKELGYAYVGALAASYGEKAEILMELGRLQEALVFDEKAMVEIRRCAEDGDAVSAREVWMYQVIRGRLYLRLGKVHEAERLFREALPSIPIDRRMYCMFAQDGLNEIEQWKQQSASPRYQLDWRWVERYRDLVSYDSRWWLTWAGPFTQEEQQTWDHLFALPLNEMTREQLGTLMKVSRERELEAAIAEQREPRLVYPAIDMQDIGRRIAAHLALQEEMNQHELNPIVRRLYQGAIEEELNYMRLIEATYEGNTEHFWACIRNLVPLPSKENMLYAFTLVKHIVRQGLENPQTADISLRLQEFIQTRLGLSLDLTPEEAAHPERMQPISDVVPPQRTMSAQTVQRFFTTVLQEGGYTDWQVTIDQNAGDARVEQGARHIYLPDKRFSLAEVKHLFIHELTGHVARLIAGAQSPLGLLGIQTKNSLLTDEGLVLYRERQAAALRGETMDDSGIRLNTWALGLACGVMTPPQTFLSLVTFMEDYEVVASLLKRPGSDRESTQKRARRYALTFCLRKFRGVPDLEQPGICYLQDALYLHGLRMIERAVAEDETVLDRLAVGNIALELLPDVEELGIVSVPQPLKKRVFDPDLDSYILSFAEQSEEGTEKRK